MQTPNEAPNNAPEILQQQRGHLALVTLNRPKALNSLTTGMVETLLAMLTHWESSDSVSAVIIKGSGDKAFCAGGDVKTIAQLGRAGDTATARRFFKSEYRTNHAISTFPKPYIALIDGITMGGGAGVSVHGPVRIATEKTLFAMPECAIGLLPDIGGSYFLPRLPGGIGMYLGLTGARLKGVDVLHAGIATHYVSSDLLPEVEAVLGKLGGEARSLSRVNQALAELQARSNAVNVQQQEEGNLLAVRDQIDAAFGSDKNSVEEIYQACEAQGGDFGRQALQMIRKGSPTSQRIVFQQLRLGATMPLDECLRMEYRIVSHLTQQQDSDFYEGVDAALIRKDGAPQWHPDSLAKVSQQDVAKYFELLPPHEELQIGGGTSTLSRINKL